MKFAMLALLFTITFSMGMFAAEHTPSDGIEIMFTIGSETARGVLFDSDISREFTATLPLALNLGDLSQREKFSYLPTGLTNIERLQNTFKIGDIAYWPPGPGFGVFYRRRRSDPRRSGYAWEGRSRP